MPAERVTRVACAGWCGAPARAAQQPRCADSRPWAGRGRAPRGQRGGGAGWEGGRTGWTPRRMRPCPPPPAPSRTLAGRTPGRPGTPSRPAAPGSSCCGPAPARRRRRQRHTRTGPPKQGFCHGATADVCVSPSGFQSVQGLHAQLVCSTGAECCTQLGSEARDNANRRPQAPQAQRCVARARGRAWNDTAEKRPRQANCEMLTPTAHVHDRARMASPGVE